MASPKSHVNGKIFKNLKIPSHFCFSIYDYAEKSAHLEVAWVWNRSIDKLLDLPEEKILEDLEDIPDMPLQAELIVEVAHPAIWAQHSETLLSSADVLIGSPSGLSVQQVEDNVRTLCQKHRRTAFVARGALWGSEDIFRMRESIAEMHITMRKHPSHLKLHSELASKMPKDTDGIQNAEVLMCQNLRSCKLKSSPTSFFSKDNYCKWVIWKRLPE
ncbi:unnamed protein product [Oikopleura dioica]|uniref:Aspartate/homoserine dehydrogenase NAD-binding domain-containing protein n=1 Tax=Oikopleura dioica TaxID=34765 RepID=E4YHF9_OIKDI|nr:unnamed protein product [Oikopleura dioica]